MSDPINPAEYLNGEPKPPFDPPLTPTITREEYQDLLDNEKNGWIVRSRKALAAGATALAGALALATPLITGDGIVTWAEVQPALIIAGGVALATGFVTWQTPNAELYRG